MLSRLGAEPGARRSGQRFTRAPGPSSAKPRRAYGSGGGEGTGGGAATLGILPHRGTPSPRSSYRPYGLINVMARAMTQAAAGLFTPACRDQPFSPPMVGPAVMRRRKGSRSRSAAARRRSRSARDASVLAARDCSRYPDALQMPVQLRVNGKKYRAEVDPETPLLWVLRDHLGLTGTRFGCGAALCGSCTVHVDGEARRSCVLRVGEIGKGAVTTIEGLGARRPHPLQQAWIEHDVPQCGYCQAGQIMQAAALLKAIPHPTDTDIDQAMSGNICRCGTYRRIRAAIKTAAASMSGRRPRGGAA
jgi:isoquinoline 1-oxidoreductase subunit alpha